MWSWLSRLIQGDPSEPTLGIDLGTLSCAGAVVWGGRVRLLTDADGMRRTPTVVARTEAGDWMVGLPALLQAEQNPHRTVFGLKHLLGRVHFPPERDDPLGLQPVTVPDPVGRPLVQLGDGRYPPEQLLALLLRKLRQAAEQELGCSVGRAVLALPVCFDTRCRQAAVTAARIAGLEPVRLLTEPLASLVVHAPAVDLSGYVAVVDVGASYVSCAVADYGRERSGELIQVLSQRGLEDLGGLALDRALVDPVADAFLRSQRVDLRREARLRVRLREALAKARCQLSEAEKAVLEIADVPGRDGAPVHLQIPLTRGRCDNYFRPVLERCRQLFEGVLREAKLAQGQVQEVFLVGGLARMPRLQAVARAAFGREPRTGEGFELSVAVGAALHGYQLALGSRSYQALSQVTTHAVGVEVEAGRVTPLLPRNVAYPAERKELQSETGPARRGPRRGHCPAGSERLVDHPARGTGIRPTGGCGGARPAGPDGR
jgi:molecular chaperone DnaK